MKLTPQEMLRPTRTFLRRNSALLHAAPLPPGEWPNWLVSLNVSYSSHNTSVLLQMKSQNFTFLHLIKVSYIASYELSRMSVDCYWEICPFELEEWYFGCGWGEFLSYSKIFIPIIFQSQC